MALDIFRQFDQACMAGDLTTMRAILSTEKFSERQINTALRHAAYYTGPNPEVREDVVDTLLDMGARVDWDDRGADTVVNAVNSKSPYLFKRILNACDGNKLKLEAALKIIRGKKDVGWAVDLVESRIGGMFHIGL